MINWLLEKLNFSFVITKTSIISTNVEFYLKTSLISNCFTLMIVFLYIINTIYSIGYLNFERDKEKARFHCFTLLSVITTIFLSYSANLFTAFIFYDLLSVFTYFLVKHHKDNDSEQHAFIYAMYLILPSMLFLLPAIISVYSVAQHTNFVEGGILSSHPVSKTFINLIFLMFIYGISKTALYPLHKWLIHAMVAPAPVSALLHAVLVVKGGLFFLYKVVNETFGIEFLQSNIYTLFGIYWPIYIAIISIVVSAIFAIGSENIKQRLAYSTISQIGYISMCLFYFSKESIFGAQMHFLCHSFAKICLFYYAGYMLARYHVANVSELKYNRNHLNVFLSIMFLIPCISLMSFPLTIGFMGKHSMIEGILYKQEDFLLLITMIVGIFLCIIYLYPIVYHLLSFNTKSQRYFVKQYFSTFCIYFSVFLISFTIILGFFVLYHH